MPLSDYLVGLVFFAGTLGAVVISAYLFTRMLAQHVYGTARALAFGVLATASLVAVQLLPAMGGVLSRSTVLGVALGELVVAIAVTHRLRIPAREARGGPPPSSRGEWLLAGFAMILVTGYALHFLLRYVSYPVPYGDAITFHLPSVAAWIQTGSIWPYTNVLPGFPTGAYPNTGDLVYVAAMLPWRSDFVVPLVEAPFLLMLGAAIYASALELGARRAPAATVGALVTAVPVIALSAIVRPLPDTILFATLAAGICFLLRHARSGRRGDLVLAGMGLGLAFGTKWYGVSAVVVILFVWVVARGLARVPLVALARETGLITGVVALTSGVWFVRNWVDTGNPVFPVRVRLLGLTIFHAPPDPIRAKYGFTIADYLGDPRILLHHALPDYRLALAAPGLAILIATALGAAVALRGLRRGESSTDRRVLACLAAAALAVVAYVITPGTAQGVKGHPVAGLIGGNSRYGTAALLLAAPVAAWAVSRHRRLRFVWGLAGVAAVVDGLQMTYAPPSPVIIKALAVVLLVSAGAWVARRWGERLARILAAAGRQGRRPALALTGAVALAVALVVAGQIDQRRFAQHRYTGRDAAIDWLNRHAPSGHKVGLAGDGAAAPLAPQYVASGPRLGNRVSYVGPIRQGMLLTYTTQARFVAALRRGGYDLLIVGRNRGSSPIPHPMRPVGWAESAGFVRVAASPYLTILAAPGSPLAHGRAGGPE